MKITKVETIRLGEFPNLLFVRIHTDEGITGLGETYLGAAAVEAYLHETAVPSLLGSDPLRIEHHNAALHGYLGYGSSGAETRGASAVDIALWDIFGKAAGQPLYQLLGGASRDRVRVYNTCAGYRYTRQRPVQAVGNWGLPDGRPHGPYEDLDAFLHRADELAESLLDEGISGMKIWPFDPYAERTGGHYISPEDLKEALEPFRKIRKAVGNGMDIMVEFHGLWDLPAASRIARALEEFEPFWFEDPLRADDLGALAEYARTTAVPVTLSETLAGRRAFRDLLEQRIAGVVMFDVGWCGGVSEAKKIVAMAEAYQLPVAPHDCTGPVVLTASVHLSVNAPNAMVQEMVRAFYTDWYRELVTALPPLAGGYLASLTGPGLGTELVPGIEQRPDAAVRISDWR